MRSVRGLLPVVVLLLAPALAACGGDDDGDGDDTAPTTSAPVEQPSDATESAADTEPAPSEPLATLPSACDVLTPEDVAAAYGVEFGAGSPGSGGHTEQDVEWQSDNCEWEAEDLAEVQLALTGPDDFATGTLDCREPAGIASTVTPVKGLDASAAWWDLDDSPPLEATLRVCTEGYNFDLEIEYEDGVDFQGKPKDQTIALAKAALVKLGG